MRGKTVVVRTFGDRPLVRRVWDADADAVYITDDVQYQRLVAGEPALNPVGFPWEDVYEVEPSLIDAVEQIWQAGRWDWRRLRPWPGTEGDAGRPSVRA
jgi:hypothetical protein